MKTILDSLRSISELLRLSRKDIQEGQDRLKEAELKTNETIALLQARKENLELSTEGAQRSSK